MNQFHQSVSQESTPESVSRPETGSQRLKIITANLEFRIDPADSDAGTVTAMPVTRSGRMHLQMTILDESVFQISKTSAHSWTIGVGRRREIRLADLTILHEYVFWQLEESSGHDEILLRSQ